MHDYTYDSVERRHWTVALLILSMVLTWIGIQLLRGIPVDFNIFVPWNSDFRLSLVVFGLAFTIFNKWLWKCEPFRLITMHSISIPNLNGTWKGTGTTSHDEHADTFNAKLTIRQSWTKISIELETKDSRSHSEVAALLRKNGTEFHIEYVYRNEPKPHALDSMNMHYGAARLRILDSTLKGEYFNGRGRETNGGLELRRECS